MNALLLVVTLAASTLVLRTGERIVVDGDVREDKGVITFRSSGVLYSLPAIEVEKVEPLQPATSGPPKARLRVSEEERKRLIAELEQNHEGTPPPPQRLLTEPVPEPSPAEKEETRRSEAEWRSRARAHEENIRRAKEELELLESRISDLQSEINTLFALGYEPRQFTYQTTQLARIQDQLPYARLEVTRAQRAWDQFREDARRAGVLPGWLR